MDLKVSQTWVQTLAPPPTSLAISLSVLVALCGMQDLSSPTSYGTFYPTVEVRSLNHWTAWESHQLCYLIWINPSGPQFSHLSNGHWSKSDSICMHIQNNACPQQELDNKCYLPFSYFLINLVSCPKESSLAPRSFLWPQNWEGSAGMTEKSVCFQYF